MTVRNGKEEVKSTTDEKLPSLHQNYKNDLCKSCPFIQSSSADVKDNVCTCTHACVRACILKTCYPTGRSVRSHSGNAAAHQGQVAEETSLIFMLYLGLFTALAKQKSVAKPV